MTNDRYKLTKGLGGRAVEKMLDIVYPNKCLFCKRVLGDAKEIACEKCVERISGAAGVVFPANVSAVYAACDYDGEARGVVHRFKYEGKRMLARPMARLIFERVGSVGGDMLLPVPLHVKRERERGFNQAALLARELAAMVARVAAYDGMERVKDTARQFELSRQERETNIAGAFALREGFDVAGADVVLVDDVLTTGATAAECAAVLLRGGAKSVGLIVFAATVGKRG